MPAPKYTQKYYFSVEGETEKLYLEWLIGQIKKDSGYRVPLECKPLSPLRFVRRANILDKKAKVFHMCDYEDPNTDPMRFPKLLKEMREAESVSGSKKFTYSLAYSNLSFELWVLLHKTDCFGSQAYIDNYWPKLKSAYKLTTVQSLSEFKEEDNFKNLVLDKLTLQDVRVAIERAKKIEQINLQNGLKKQTYKKFEYYADDPSLSVWESIEDMLRECGLL